MLWLAISMSVSIKFHVNKNVYLLTSVQHTQQTTAYAHPGAIQAGSFTSLAT